MKSNNISSVFGQYASAYDHLNADKNYEFECLFLEEIFQLYGRGKIDRVLDLGCGTGNHAVPLAQRGYCVHGVDKSEEMLAIARKKANERLLQDKVHFDHGDIQQIDLKMVFDAVICMFAVLSYQTSDGALVSTFNTVNNHLKKDGLFIADFWYGPAVLRQRPEERVKEVRSEGDRIIRNARPEMNAGGNIVDVNYGIERVHKDQVLEEYRERHSMRFFFKPEMRAFLENSGFILERFCRFADMGQEADEESWNAMIIARKK